MGAQLKTEITHLHQRLDGLRDEVLKVLGSLEMLQRLRGGKPKQRERLHNLEMRGLNLCDLLAANKSDAEACIASDDST